MRSRTLLLIVVEKQEIKGFGMCVFFFFSSRGLGRIYSQNDDSSTASAPLKATGQLRWPFRVRRG